MNTEEKLLLSRTQWPAEHTKSNWFITKTMATPVPWCLDIWGWSPKSLSWGSRALCSSDALGSKADFGDKSIPCFMSVLSSFLKNTLGKNTAEILSISCFSYSMLSPTFPYLLNILHLSVTAAGHLISILLQQDEYFQVQNIPSLKTESFLTAPSCCKTALLFPGPIYGSKSKNTISQ